MTIIEKLKEKGYNTVPSDFYSMIGVWKSWYDGDVKNFHDYKVFNGQKTVQCHRYTLGMAKKVAEDWANLLMNEKVQITLEGKKEQEFVDGIFKDNNFRVKANESQEMKAGLGTAGYVARVIDVDVREDTGSVIGGGKIKLDYPTAQNVYPLSWENGIVTECAFTSSVTAGKDKYLYLQIHHKDESGKYVIENYIYSDREGNLSEANLADVKGFERVPPVFYTDSDKPWFVIDRLNIANNVDNTLPMGIPAFANAIDQLKGVDIAYDSYVNEFVLGKKRIMVKPGATKDLDGEPVFDPNELTYYVLPEDTTDGNIIHEVDMTLRTEAHNAGLQDMLNALSSRCGFGENHYKFDNGSVATATQVVSENSSMFRTIKKHEIILESVLIDLCRIILHIGNSIMNAGLDEDVEISIDFDDSIIEDKATEFSRDMQMMNAGVLNDWEFRMKWRNEDEATAKAALPKMEDIATEKQEEVE